MTKIMMNINENNDIFFDCDNHAGDHDACTIASTLCGVLVYATQRAGFLVDEYKDGHVRIYIPNANEVLREQFYTVMRAFDDLIDDYPELVKRY